MITSAKNTQLYKGLCLANLVADLAPPLAKTTPNVYALLTQAQSYEAPIARRKDAEIKE